MLGGWEPHSALSPSGSSFGVAPIGIHHLLLSNLTTGFCEFMDVTRSVDLLEFAYTFAQKRTISKRQLFFSRYLLVPHPSEKRRLFPASTRLRLLSTPLLGRIACISYTQATTPDEVAWSVCRSVCLSVYLSVGHDRASPAKMDEPIEMPFWVWTRVGPRNHIFDGGSATLRKGTLWWRGHSGAYRTCPAVDTLKVILKGQQVVIRLHATVTVATG